MTTNGQLVHWWSTTSPSIFPVLSCRWFLWNHPMKFLIRSLYSSPLSSVIQPTMEESSKNFYRWHVPEWRQKSKVFRVNQNGDGTVP